MKRSRTAAPGLKHLAFFEAIGEVEENSPKAQSATAGLLMLRLIDHWVLAGPVMVEPESVSVRSVRHAIMQLQANDPSREVLLGMVNTMQTVREVDLQPILPRLFAYAGCLERRVELTLASDVYGTIARLADENFDADLLIDSFLRLGYCQRLMGTLGESEVAYASAGKIAKRQKETARALRSQIGAAVVMMARGNLPKAEELLAAIAIESENADCLTEAANALHARSAVAQRRGDFGRAVAIAYDAFTLTPAPNDRDLILGDIGAYFISMRRFDAARDALMILEATTISDIVRLNARVNMVALAARAANEELFRNALTRLDGVTLHAEARVNLLIESARGFRCFGEPQVAIDSLKRARELAAAHGLNRSVFEAEEMLAHPELYAQPAANDVIPAEQWDGSADVERELRKMALAVV